MAQKSVIPTIQVGSGNIFNITEHDYFNLFMSSLPNDIIYNPYCCITNWVNYKSTRYQPKLVLVYGTDKSSCPIFLEIQLIVIYQNSPLFICSSLLNLGLHYNVGGFEVTQDTKWLSVKYEDLFDSFPLFPLQVSVSDMLFYIILYDVK